MTLLSRQVAALGLTQVEGEVLQGQGVVVVGGEGVVGYVVGEGVGWQWKEFTRAASS